MVFIAAPVSADSGGGATTANGWYEGEEIYYILRGVEDGVTQRGENDLSEHFGDEGVLFDDVEGIVGAAEAGLVTIQQPGIVVLCPIISEEGAEAPGNTQLSESFPMFPDTF